MYIVLAVQLLIDRINRTLFYLMPLIDTLSDITMVIRPLLY